MSEDPRPGTVGSVDRRVERVEQQVAGLDTRLALVEQGQIHARELQRQGFDSVNARLEVVGAKVDSQAAVQALASAEAKAREVKSISNARLLAMVASAASISGVVIGTIVALTR
jgi:hypothetical protein